MLFRSEYGLLNPTIHKVDERASLADMAALTDVYSDILRRYFV